MDISCSIVMFAVIPQIVDHYSFDDWIRLFCKFYPVGAIPADWYWPRETWKEFLHWIDSEDIALFCILSDLSDRLTSAISPLQNKTIRLAYEKYFLLTRSRRTYNDYKTLVDSIINESKKYREQIDKKKLRGILLLEWCMLADANNQTKLSGRSPTNLLLTHSCESSWRQFLLCASNFSNAAKSTDETQERHHFDEGAKALGIDSEYRPPHIYRLLCYILNKINSGVDGWFDVNKLMQTAFKSLLPPFLAAVATCQCQKIPQTADNFRFLSAVAQDRLGFLELAADLDKEEKLVVQNLIHFGPARYLKSTSTSGMLRRAFAKYGKYRKRCT
jgi:hypothetical protein